MQSLAQHALDQQPDNVYVREQDAPPDAPLREVHHRPARSSRRIRGCIITAAVVLAILVRGWYYVKRPSVPSPDVREQLFSESHSEEVDESRSVGETEEPEYGPDPSQPEDYQQPKSAEVDREALSQEESTVVQKSNGYEAPDSFRKSNTQEMFEKIFFFGGTMEFRKPSPKAGEEFLTFMITTTPAVRFAPQDPWLTEDELKTHPVRQIRKDTAPLAMERVENAIEELVDSLDSQAAYNPFKEITIDGYGKILVQRILVCHLQDVDIGVVVNQPDGHDEAIPIMNLDMDGHELDLFRQTLEDALAEFVEGTRRNGKNYKVLRISESTGVPTTTVASLFGAHA
ncbi:uncharacterized protein EMH_0097790 [Eimeria mitis]|uniref:Uncharacterized protein n=1 Tax=Eimeria mitis TaxID=44415 RepID=U6JRM2_9EIME|nr:uncharacterized protein EMH_0097790 [Eimeria mitis]CDJ28084.1 hypothetical protein, conserved [Eimeria mitis]